MSRAYLSLGSNVDAAAHLRAAVRALQNAFGEVVMSPVYRTRAVGFDGPDFHNAAAIIESDLDPHALNAWLHALEDAHGRDRKWSALRRSHAGHRHRAVRRTPAGRRGQPACSASGTEARLRAAAAGGDRALTSKVPAPGRRSHSCGKRPPSTAPCWRPWRSDRAGSGRPSEIARLPLASAPAPARGCPLGPWGTLGKSQCSISSHAVGSW